MSLERALAVARAFDAHPHLRPRRVGGDPARINVEPSLESVVGANGLPIEWLTVRRTEGSGSFEGGEIQLFAGRGGWMADKEDGEWRYSLTGHSIEQTWLADTLAAPGAVAGVANLFEELVVATDAAYGCVLPWAWWPYPLDTFATARLPGVFWLNYFGPAFVQARPRLAAGAGARILETGGVLVRTTDEPWQPYEDGIPAWQAEIRAVLGHEAYEWARPNPGLPSVEEHLAASPGSMEMPWTAWPAQKTDDNRARKHTAARTRLAKILQARDEPVLAESSVEWSTSLDRDDWSDFAHHLSHKLGRDLSATLGKAAIAVISSAPLHDKGSVLLDTDLGAIRLAWFVGDEHTLDIWVRGGPNVSADCQAWFD